MQDKDIIIVKAADNEPQWDTSDYIIEAKHQLSNEEY